MIGIREYLSITGEISATYHLPVENVIADLISLDTISTHFLQSGIQDLTDSNSRNEFIEIVSSAIETDLVKEVVAEIVNRKELLPGILKEFALVTEHLTEIKVDLSQYSTVSAEEIDKLSLILRKKHRDRFVIVSITLPGGSVMTKYMNTFEKIESQIQHSSDLDTLLSLYMEVNSGA